MSDHDDQQQVPDSHHEEQVKPEKDDLQDADAKITEEAISQVLSRDGTVETPEDDGREDDDSPATESMDSTKQSRDVDEPSEIEPEDMTLTEAAVSDEEPLPEDESLDPEGDNNQISGGDEVVTVTVNRLQELGELLKELNFREMIMRFGELQAELDSLRDGIRRLKSLSQGNSVEAIEQVDFEVALKEAATRMIAAAERLNAFSAFSGQGRANCVELAGQVMDTLEALRESHAARLSMAADLSNMVESDASNEQLASSALEFAVFLREIDAASDLEAFDIAFAELKALYSEMQQLGTGDDDVEELVPGIRKNAEDLEQVADQLSRLQQFHRESRNILSGMTLNGKGDHGTEDPEGGAESGSAETDAATDSEPE